MGSPVQVARHLQRVTKTGAWLMVKALILNRMELGAKEWRDALFLQYGLEPPDLPNYCDVCNTKFSIYHALDCKRGVLVMAHHNELWDGVSDLTGKSFTPSNVRDDPLIFEVCSVKKPKAKPARTTGSTDRDNAPPPEATE